MKFIVMIKANEKTEAGVMPSEKLIADMMAYNEKLVEAGVMESGEGLHPSSKGTRLSLKKNGITVTDGPFAETKELVAGFWIWNVKSKEEAIAWAKQIPIPDDANEDEASEIEIRQIFEAEDFGEDFTPELRAKEDKLREKISKK